MANDNLDLKGSVDIDVGQAQRSFDTLSSSLERVTRVQASFNEMTAAQARVSRTVSQNTKQQADSILSLARAYTETQKAAAIASDTQIKQSQATAKAAEDSARRQAAAAKSAAAAQAQYIARNTTATGNLGKPSAGDFAKNGSAADFNDANDNKTLAAMRKFYSQQEDIAKKAAASEFAARGQYAQQSFNDELKARRVQLAQMRNDAQAAFANLTPKIDLNDAGQLNQLRYQLYDIATAAGVMGVAMVGASGYAVKTAADYEAAFTNVARTVEKPLSEIGDLRAGLIELSETVPVSTTQLAQVEALGAQLGISEQSLTQFTETTAQFASVSGVTEEQVANSFGAIFNLTKAGAENFERLASSINYVGINSVATDAEILKMTEEISASTTQAGYAADQTVGFAAALASLRIQPEQARGVVLRLFSDVDQAVSTGGKSLDAYANQLGLTSKAAADLWKSDPSQFTDRLIKTLSTADDLNGAIRGLGITQTRETNVLQRLAGNYNVYAQSMSDATSEYARGTSLSEAYGKTQDTLAARLQILQNTFQNLAARFGESLGGILKPIITFISQVLASLNRIPAPMFTVITAVTAIIGVFGLLIAAGAGLLGTMLAIVAAMKGFKSITGTTTLSFATLGQVVRQVASEMGLGAAANRIYGVTVRDVGVGAVSAAAALRAKAATMFTDVAATDAAAVANRSFSASLLGIPIVNVIAALSIAVPLVISLAQAINGAKSRNDELAQALLDSAGGLEGLSSALAKDTAAADGHTNGMRTIKSSVDEFTLSEGKAAEATAARASAVNEALGITQAADGATRGATAGIDQQTQVIGTNTKAWLANALAQQAMNDKDSAIYKLFNDKQTLDVARRYGIDLQAAIADGFGTSDGVTGALNRQIAAAQQKAGTLAIAGKDQSTALSDLKQVGDLATQIGGSIDGLNGKLTVQQGIQQALGVAVDGTADSLTGEGDAAAGAAESFQAQISATSNYANSLYAMQQSLDQNGATFNQWSASGIANVQALQNTLNASVQAGAGMGLSAADSMVAALGSIDVSTNQIKSIVNTLAAANPTLFANMNIDDIIAKAQQVQKILKGAGFTTNASIGKDVLAAQQSKLSQLISQRDAMQSQLRSTQQSADLSGNTGRTQPKPKKAPEPPELKTTAEYASDIGSAMQEAFSKKFGVQQAMDDITSKFAALRDRIKEARLQVKSLNADLYKLASDRNILQIQLKVATDYGDTTRADAIRAELAQNSADTASKQKDLAKAIASASTQLNGNTEAAIQNRAAVLDLLGAYQQQIQSYAATGASAAQVTAYAQRLRGEFVQQLTQLGYNSASVKFYAGTFDTLTRAVNKVPTHKAVKVTADTGDAMGKLNGVGNRISGLSGQLSDLNAQIAATQAKIENQKKANAINKQINELTRQRTKLLGNGADNVAQRNLGQINAIQKQIDALNNQLSGLGYARGGMVGGVPGGGRSVSRYSDDILANLKIGEGVVNLDGMKMLGANGLNAINNQQNPFPPMIINNSQNSSNSGTLVVELSPTDRQLLASGKNVQVTISRDEIARANNAANLNTANRGANG